MTNHDHERALELIMRRGTEEVAAHDADWLEVHLATCDSCADYAETFHSAGQLLRSVAVTAKPALVASTQARVRARAHQLEEQRARTVLIAISFCLGAMSSAASGWLWWRFGGWVADRFGLSQAIVEPGVILFLVMPALIIAGLMVAFPQSVVEERWVAAWTEHEGGSQ